VLASGEIPWEDPAPSTSDGLSRLRSPTRPPPREPAARLRVPFSQPRGYAVARPAPDSRSPDHRVDQRPFWLTMRRQLLLATGLHILSAAALAARAGSTWSVGNCWLAVIRVRLPASGAGSGTGTGTGPEGAGAPAGSLHSREPCGAESSRAAADVLRVATGARVCRGKMPRPPFGIDGPAELASTTHPVISTELS
jgi:hypothetical protein